MSANGRYVVFVRLTTNSHRYAAGRLQLVALQGGSPRLIGPIARLRTAGIGYFDHYRLAEATTWHE